MVAGHSRPTHLAHGPQRRSIPRVHTLLVRSFFPPTTAHRATFRRICVSIAPAISAPCFLAVRACFAYLLLAQFFRQVFVTGRTETANGERAQAFTPVRHTRHHNGEFRSPLVAWDRFTLGSPQHSHMRASHIAQELGRDSHALSSWAAIQSGQKSAAELLTPPQYAQFMPTPPDATATRAHTTDACR